MGVYFQVVIDSVYLTCHACNVPFLVAVLNIQYIFILFYGNIYFCISRKGPDRKYKRRTIEMIVYINSVMTWNCSRAK